MQAKLSQIAAVPVKTVWPTDQPYARYVNKNSDTAGNPGSDAPGSSGQRLEPASGEGNITPPVGTPSAGYGNRLGPRE